MDMTAAYREVGSYRGAMDICGTTPKTVKRVVLAAAETVTETGPVSIPAVVRVYLEQPVDVFAALVERPPRFTRHRYPSVPRSLNTYLHRA